MKVPSRQRERGLQFNITPLIDIIFLLIIFFLAATHFVRSETLEAVELPVAVEGEFDADEQLKRLVVTITADHKLHVNAGEVTFAAVEQMVLNGIEKNGQTFEVRIRADRSVPFRVIEPIMLACARAGVARFKFAVLQK